MLLTDFCFCLAGSRLPRWGRGRRKGRVPRQGQRAREEPGQEREGERADEER